MFSPQGWPSESNTEEFEMLTHAISQHQDGTGIGKLGAESRMNCSNG
jgi:hypothetical protein